MVQTNPRGVLMNGRQCVWESQGGGTRSKRRESWGSQWGERSKLRVKLSVEVSGPVIRDCF